MPIPANFNPQALARVHPNLAELVAQADGDGRKNVQRKGAKNAGPTAYELACLSIAGKIEQRGDMPGILNLTKAALAEGHR